MRVPLASSTAAMSPVSAFRSTATILPFLPRHAELLGEAAQEFGVEARVEVERVGHGRQRAVRPAD